MPIYEVGQVFTIILNCLQKDFWRWISEGFFFNVLLMPAFAKTTVPQGTSLQMCNNFYFWVDTLMNSCVLFYYIKWLILT